MPLESRTDQVLVIGAGIAGIAAARRLRATGFQVRVLEGRTRMGGRIWTDDSLGCPVDLGASWIHGVRGNPLTEIARLAEAGTYPTNFDALALYTPSRTRLGKPELMEVGKAYEGAIERLVAVKMLASPGDSMKGAVEQVLGELALPESVRRAVRWQIAAEIEMVWAADLTDLALYSWDEDEEFPGECAMFPAGYRQIVDWLAADLEVELNQTVRSVDISGRPVRVETDRGVFAAEKVVITLPLGVLKEGAVAFSPPLPYEKQRSIARLGFGAMNKVALKFPHRFWPSEIHRMGLVGESVDCMLEFFELEHLLGEPVLIAVSRGTHARSLEQSEQATLNLVMEQLGEMFGDSLPHPISATFTGWSSDPFALGAYSHLAPGATMDDYASLAEPVCDRLFFAGEATSPYPGTVHGAFLSGEREAERIARIAA